MTNNSYIENLNKLATILCKSSLVNSFDKDGEKESYKLAISILDIKDSIEEINKSIEAIQLHMDEEGINDALWDIGEEFRHIIYHILESRFYNYLNGNVSD